MKMKQNKIPKLIHYDINTDIRCRIRIIYSKVETARERGGGVLLVSFAFATFFGIF